MLCGRVWERSHTLFFAGEAVAGPCAALCSGAYYGGQAQAQAVSNALGS
ncbi:hypothetical protein FIU89_00035 [Roseovarius sp. THAF27]|nr:MULTISPECIES: hypothetical protein [unclassified Roseovarius]QFT78978.1 hypothetical protein FIU89_00035 [Roseovarius sp. THAF27]QFT97868.1 hypothetical protein FIU85_11175 [Roseovarius sp. THAF8]